MYEEPYDSDDSFNAQFRAYLIDALYCTPAEERSQSCWVMNEEWFLECRKLTDSQGCTLWEPSLSARHPDLLFGKPIKIRDSGGTPHLEPA